MVQRGKELRDVKGDNACLQTLSPPGPNQVGKEDARILSGTLGDAPELVRLEGTVGHAIELKPARQHLFDKFSQSVQEHDGPEQLGSGIIRLPWLRYDDRQGVLKMRGPMPRRDARLGYASEQGSDVQIPAPPLEERPCDVVRSGGGVRSTRP